jgi:hypothetical protein
MTMYYFTTFFRVSSVTGSGSGWVLHFALGVPILLLCTEKHVLHAQLTPHHPHPHHYIMSQISVILTHEEEKRENGGGIWPISEEKGKTSFSPSKY